MNTHAIKSIISLTLVAAAQAQETSDTATTLTMPSVEITQSNAPSVEVIQGVAAGSTVIDEQAVRRVLDHHVAEMQGHARSNIGEPFEDVVRWAVADGGTSPMLRLFPASGAAGTYIGISVSPVSEELSGQISLPPNTGLVINHLEAEGPAGKAGLQKGDIIAKLDDQILIHPQQLSVLVGNKKEGESVKITYLRKGQTSEITVTLAKRETSKEAGATYRIGDADVIIDAKGGQPIRTYTKQFGSTTNIVPAVPAQAADPELAKKLGKIEATLEELKKALAK